MSCFSSYAIKSIKLEIKNWDVASLPTFEGKEGNVPCVVTGGAGQVRLGQVRSG